MNLTELNTCVLDAAKLLTIDNKKNYEFILKALYKALNDFDRFESVKSVSDMGFYLQTVSLVAYLLEYAKRHSDTITSTPIYYKVFSYIQNVVFMFATEY